MATFPTLVTNSPSVGDAFNGITGPFKVGSKFYIQLINSANQATKMFRGGPTNSDAWSQPGVDGPSYAGTDQGMGNCVVGTVIFNFRTTPGAIVDEVVVDRYDTSTESWLPTIHSGAGTPGDISSGLYVVSRPVNGDIVVFGSPNSIAGQVGYFIYNIAGQTFTAWQAAGPVPGGVQNTFPIGFGAVRGNGRTHFAFVSVHNGGAPQLMTLQQQVLEDTNVLGAFSTIDSFATADNLSNNENSFNQSSDGVNVVVQWSPLSTSATIKTFKGLSASPVVFAQTNIPVVSGATVGQTGQFIIIGSDGKTYVAFADNVSSTTGLFTSSGGAFSLYVSLGPKFAFFCQCIAFNDLTHPFAMWLDGSVFFWIIDFGGSAGGTTGLLQSKAATIILPDPRIHCSDPNLKRARVATACTIKRYRIQVGKNVIRQPQPKQYPVLFDPESECTG